MSYTHSKWHHTDEKHVCLSLLRIYSNIFIWNMYVVKRTHHWHWSGNTFVKFVCVLNVLSLHILNLIFCLCLQLKKNTDEGEARHFLWFEPKVKREKEREFWWNCTEFLFCRQLQAAPAQQDVWWHSFIVSMLRWVQNRFNCSLNKFGSAAFHVWSGLVWRRRTSRQGEWWSCSCCVCASVCEHL